MGKGKPVVRFSALCVLGVAYATARTPRAQQPSPDAVAATGSVIAPGVHLPVPYKTGEKLPPEVRTLSVAVPARPPAALQQRVDRVASSATEREVALREYTAWWVDRIAATLPKAEKDRLTATYLTFFRAAVPLTLASTNLDDTNIRARQAGIARALTALVLSERDILRPFPQAQEVRYGRRIRFDIPLPPRADIERDILRFTSGTYLKEAPPKAPKPVPVDSVRVLEEAGAIGTFRLGFKRLPTLNPYRGPTLFCADASERSYVSVTGRIAVGWVGYAFTGARSLVPGTWEDIGLPGLYHASILAGRWYLEKASERVITVKCGGAGLKPLSYSHDRTTYTWRFHDWTVANGCGGQYLNPDDGDTLTIFKVFTPLSSAVDPAEDVARQILGTTKDANGGMCRARYGAYPQGPYGLTWVCHQACNAFTHLKWGLDPVYYPISFPLYGTRGNLGVADVTAPCACEDTHANPCAVSGNPGSCWLNTTLGLGDAWGDNLNSGFHFRNGWIDTQCKYRQEPAGAHVPGWDFESVVVGE